MAAKIELSDGAARWLKRQVDAKVDDWHWGRGNPSADDKLYASEVQRALGGADRARRDRNWEGPGDRPGGS